MATSFSEVVILPEKYLKTDEQRALYKANANNPEELKKHFKWWSMHDIMDFYHSGFAPIENKANALTFKIDFTSPEMLENQKVNPDLINRITTGMSQLKGLESEIERTIMDVDKGNTAQIQAMAMRAPPPRGGSKNKYPKKKGGEAMQGMQMPGMPMPGMPMPGPAPGMPMPGPAPGMPMPGMPMPAPAAPAQKPYSMERIQMECFKDLLNINISTQDKIFEVSKTTTPIQGNTALAGGRKYKTKKYYKPKNNKTKKIVFTYKPKSRKRKSRKRKSHRK